MTKRYFEFSEGTSNKFWEVWADGVKVFTRYGKIGAAGQLTVKKVGSDPDAKKLRDKLIGEKTGKGYVAGGAKKPAKAKANGKAAKPAETDDAEPEVIVIPNGAYRLEAVEGKSAKFWQIWQQSKVITVTFGKIGTSGTVQKKKYKDEWEAGRDFRKQLDEKKKKGYQFVPAGPRITAQPAAVNPQLEAAVVKDPSDGAFMVYGDWLMEQNDPRGAMLAFKGNDKKRATSQAALALKQRAFFYGPLAVYTGDEDGDDAVKATWRHGWIDSLHLTATSESWGGDEGPKPIPVSQCAELVRLLPKVASSRLVRELVIGSPVAGDSFEFGPVIKELVKAMPGLPNLRRLVLGDFTYEDSELSWSHLGSLKDLWPVVGKLEYLKIHAGSMDLNKITAPELREIWIETGGFNKKNVDAIINANAPKLETLNIWFGRKDYGCDVEPKHLPVLLEALPKKFPKLRHLGLANATWGDDLAPLLAKAKVLKQLETLDVSMSHLTDAGIRVYAGHKDAFKHLASIDFSRCLIEEETKLKSLCKSVDLQSQEDPSEHQPDPDDPSDAKSTWWRYSAVGE